VKKELQDKLVDRYPLTFAECKYVDTGDGWYDLIDAMCSIIESNIRSIPDEGLRKQVFLSQGKEKFGGLRWYMSRYVPFIEGVVSLAEDMSLTICERCGNKGKPRDGGWITTLCDKCHEEKHK
jgi:hypothetical protein